MESLTAAPPRHDHAHQHGHALAIAAQGALEAQGEQWTRLRAAVFAILEGFGRPASAYDVADRLSRAEDRRIAANSVYRILDLFVTSNLVHRIESANAYVVNPHPGCVHDCIFLICGGCGRTLHVDDDVIAARVRGVGADMGFVAERPVIELHGKCADCATGTPRHDVHGQH